MSFRSDRISQIPFQMPFHTCRSLSPSVLPLLPLALSCGTCILSPPKNYAMHGSVLFLLFFIGSSVAFPDRDWFMRTSTWAYISRGRLYCTLYLTSVSIRPWNIAAPTRSRSLSVSLGLSVSLVHLMAPPPGTINSTPDIIVGATQWQKPIQNL